MFGMGMPEILLILAIALIVLGPKKLPEIAKSLGRGIAEFKRATQELKDNLDADDDLKEARETIREAKKDLEETVHGSVTDNAAGYGASTVSETGPRHSVEGETMEGSVKQEPGQGAGVKEPAKDA
jgi:sec-independent protein translocase protein TatB